MRSSLQEASFHVEIGRSVIVPLVIPGLPLETDALGLKWRRKSEFHLTVASAATIESADGGDEAWETARDVVARHRIGSVMATSEVRRVAHPTEGELKTLIVMIEAPALEALYRDLSDALGVTLSPPPAHVTLFSTDPDRGIGIDDDAELAQRAPQLPEDQQDEVRRAMNFDEVFPDDDGLPSHLSDDVTVAIGRTDRVFTPRVMRALTYASHVHAGDLRKGTGIPYLAHLVAVAVLVAEDGGGELEVMAALLHDTAEDHGGERRLSDVRRRFGPDVEVMVRELSDSLADEGETKDDWRPRKEHYLAHLRAGRHTGVLRVSNADKLHNARAILADHRAVGDELWKRFTGTKAEQLWYYRCLADIFTDRRPGSPLARELDRTVEQLEQEAGAAS